MVHLVTQIQRVDAELALNKEVLNEKVSLLEAEYASKQHYKRWNLFAGRKKICVVKFFFYFGC